MNPSENSHQQNSVRSASQPSLTQPRFYSRRRIQFGLSTTLIGFLIFLIGARPSIFGLDRSPVIGFVQIAVFLIGLAIMCLGAYISFMVLWKDQPPSIVADIGLRLVATGYVISVFTGMADVFGLGSHPLPHPYFGEVQAAGVELGQVLILAGFLALIPYQRLSQPGHQPSSKLTDNQAQ